ncbi:MULTISPECIES: ABC transporter permease [Gulbenkiania]|uniref:ABC-type spermidine/putrescine transport system, permease component I n=2 Tax=Gulbenkiania TaxID=397456 RepID=A0A0K6GXS1_9NEIS|nr:MULTISPECIES: ABC transporter permease [Gulbenkiania]TCW32934.1 spermidine/putrescine transport system permease protein [Gulbenkiania mobilis]CUA83375.1 ABC-type spermidine/putrescine transport system, permease component I [Gulbenkiania indica]
MRDPRTVLRRALLLAPTGLTLFVFMVIPMGLMGWMSVLEPDTYGGVRWHALSLDAYVQFWYERDLDDSLILNTAYMEIFLRSFLLAGFATLATLVLGFPTALYIALQDERTRQRLILLISIPFWTNLLVRTYAWMLLLRNGGLIDSGLGALGLGSGALDVLYTPTAVAIGFVYSFLPFMVLPIYTSLEKMDWRLVEAAFDLGANRWTALRRVVLPMALPGIAAGCLLVFIPALGSYYIPELLGGGKSLMIGNLIQNQFGTARNWPFGAALSFTLLALVLLAMIVYTRRFRQAPGE